MFAYNFKGDCWHELCLSIRGILVWVSRCVCALGKNRLSCAWSYVCISSWLFKMGNKVIYLASYIFACAVYSMILTGICDCEGSLVLEQNISFQIILYLCICRQGPKCLVNSHIVAAASLYVLHVA